MKVALLLVSALAVIVVAAAEEKYTTRYDNTDVDGVIANPRLVNKYAQCILEDDDANCTADAKELKRVIPDALSNDCAKCNDKQKETTKKVLKHIIKHRQELWDKLKVKFDPDDKYSKMYEDRVRELQE